MKHVSSIIILALIFVACQKEVFENRDYPRVNTLPVTSTDTEGVQLRGKVLSKGSSPITKQGFIWSDILFSVGTDINNKERFFINDLSQTGTFEANVDFSLPNNKTIYVSAFSITNEYTSFGEVISFTSQGCKTPQIHSFSPEQAQIGDTITINGERFSYLKSKNTVSFNGKIANTVECDNNKILAIVPRDLQANESALKLNCYDKETTAIKTFGLLQLKLNEFYPTKAFLGDTITLTGMNFSKTLAYNKVYFNESLAQVLVSKEGILKVKVPADLSQQINTIKVKVGQQEQTYQTSFTLNKSIVNSLNKTAYQAGDTIIISGEGFNENHPQYHTVQIGAVKCPVLKVTSTELFCLVPYEIKGGSYNITMQQADYAINVTNALQILSPWTRMSDYPGNAAPHGAGFVLDDRFVFVPVDYDHRVWSYQAQSDTWTQLNSTTEIPLSTREYSVGVSAGNTGLVGLGYYPYYSVPSMHRYQPETDTWKKIADIPGSPHHRKTVAAGVGNEVYVFLGDYNRHFWKYNMDTDTWSELNAIPGYGHRYESSGFVIDNKFYVIGGLNGYDWKNYRDVWAYDILTGKWTQKSDFPGEARHSAVAFTINGKGYYGTGRSKEGNHKDFYEYEPKTDTWKRIADFEGEARYNAVSFTMGNAGYITIGDTYSYMTYFKDVWKFEPLN